MKIMMKDNWLGKMLDYPTNVCVFGWGVLWRLALAVAASAFVTFFVWLWCKALQDGILSGSDNEPMAFASWLILTVITAAGMVMTRDYWYDNVYVKKLRAAVVAMCPTIEWDK